MCGGRVLRRSGVEVSSFRISESVLKNKVRSMVTVFFGVADSAVCLGTRWGAIGIEAVVAGEYTVAYRQESYCQVSIGPLLCPVDDMAGAIRGRKGVYGAAIHPRSSFRVARDPPRRTRRMLKSARWRLYAKWAGNTRICAPQSNSASGKIAQSRSEPSRNYICLVFNAIAAFLRIFLTTSSA